MNLLETELHRLYLIADVSSEAPSLMSADGQVRAMVMELSRPADWSALSAVWQRVQRDLDLPAPAIAVTGNDGYQLWFSLAAPVPTAQAKGFLESLQKRYLSSIEPERISLMPTANEHAQLVPALQTKTEQWSAFVAPDLAVIFADSPGLDVCPSPDAQAKVLTNLDCIKPEVFQVALHRLGSTSAATLPSSPVSAPTATSKPNTDAQQFLRDVMNDQSVDLHLRVEAAKALLPYS
jgi:hypothetical protein